MAGFIDNLDEKEGVLTKEFHIGQTPLSGINIRKVVGVQLDGDELDHFFNTFQGMPHTRKRVQYWHDDLAKFILENW